MKSASNPARRLIAAAIVLSTTLWGSLGCETKSPTSALSQADTWSATGVMDFDGSGAAVTTVNPTLTEAGVPGFIVQNPGTVQFAGYGTAWSLVSPGALGTTRSLRVSGAVTAARMQLWIPLDTASPTGYYDASLFSGIRFYLKVQDADNTSPKFFSLPTAQTVPVPDGTCIEPGCYNHFGYNYESTGGQWRLVDLPFTVLARGGGWGNPTNPTTFSGANLKQVVQIQWQEDNPNYGLSGPVTTSTADFEIDQISFY